MQTAVVSTKSKRSLIKYWKIKGQRQNLEAHMLTFFAIEIYNITPLDIVCRSHKSSVCAEGDCGLACRMLLRDLLKLLQLSCLCLASNTMSQWFLQWHVRCHGFYRNLEARYFGSMGTINELILV